VDLTGRVDEVARALLGASITRAGVTVRLVEVEAYAGESDPASHAARGRTPRNAVMYGPAGHWYVYLSYGVHWCANVVTGATGQASAVLLRGAEVVAGHDLARSRRPGRPDGTLARGPASLAAVLALTGPDSGEPVSVTTGQPAGPHVVSGPRVGVSSAADVPWRFWLPGEPGVSAYRRASPRPRAGGSPV
jgi:DNA-3-methyladenine glycosylase